MTNNGRERVTLERTLGLGTVVLIGLAYMTPLIVLGTYGVVAQLSNGTVPTAYLVTLVAMLFTALSYGRMASRGVANSAFCVDERGTIAAVYRKVQLYKGGESEAFVAGDELLVVELRRIRIGLMICFDVEFPEVARALARGRPVRHDLREHGALRERPRGVRIGASPGERAAARLRQPGRSGQNPELCRGKYRRLRGRGSTCASKLFGRGDTNREPAPSGQE